MEDSPKHHPTMQPLSRLADVPHSVGLVFANRSASGPPMSYPRLASIPRPCGSNPRGSCSRTADNVQASPLLLAHKLSPAEWLRDSDESASDRVAAAKCSLWDHPPALHSS